jgi:superfamily I DNA and RNA helicase
MTFVPDEAVARRLAGIEVVGPETLPSLLESYPAIGEDDLRLVNAAIQRIATIKPAVRRSNVVHANSRGGVMQRIEREIANLDQWQKRAAIETPDGPQRVRGLGAPARRSFLP